MRLFTVLASCLLFCLLAGAAVAAESDPVVELHTNRGLIVVRLNPGKAPATAKNFLGYVNSGFYNGTIFHRVIRGFMIQGGGFTADMTEKPTRSPIKNEADNGLKNDRYTIAMARTNNPHSATAQFFINTKDNAFLNHKSPSGAGWGYCVFGTVIEGKDVVDAIEASRTHSVGMYDDVPVDAVVIEKAVLRK
jgi:peptidyl-prolyl cis-trans isomerase B (cyclophilin B)